MIYIQNMLSIDRQSELKRIIKKALETRRLDFHKIIFGDRSLDFITEDIALHNNNLKTEEEKTNFINYICANVAYIYDNGKNIEVGWRGFNHWSFDEKFSYDELDLVVNAVIKILEENESFVIEEYEEGEEYHEV